jgi:hypothetical protein
MADDTSIMMTLHQFIGRPNQKGDHYTASGVVVAPFAFP